MKATAAVIKWCLSRAHPKPDRLQPFAARRFIFLVIFFCLALQGCSLEGVLKRPGPSDSPVLPEEEISQTKALYGTILSYLENADDDRTGLLKSRQELEKHIANFPEDKGLPEIAIIGRVIDSLVSVTNERNRVTAESLSRAESIARLEERLEKSVGEKNALEAELKETVAEKEELLSIIEKLKALEIDMGQKRRKVR